jgi:hypothetical protein
MQNSPNKAHGGYGTHCFKISFWMKFTYGGYEKNANNFELLKVWQRKIAFNFAFMTMAEHYKWQMKKVFYVNW